MEICSLKYNNGSVLEFKKGMKDGIPIALGYLAVSFTFGIEAFRGGLPPLLSAVISVTNVTSAGQFAALSVIAANGSYFEMFLTQFVINLRYMLMSFSLSQKFDDRATVPKRLLAGFGITDEIFGIGAAREGKVDPAYIYGAMAVAIPGWTVGTFFGSLSGDILPAMIVSALGVAIYGMFLAIIIPPAKHNKAVMTVVILAMVLSSAFYYLPYLNKVSSGFTIIIVTVLVSLIAALIHPVREEEHEQHA
ncbi:MAG: AzlC family ABC transporter permease [Lachnospiraceae bacterium]|nr:AzlC family ABC transporter permease [Lachnospiraceae bacterium]